MEGSRGRWELEDGMEERREKGVKGWEVGKKRNGS